MAILSSHTLDSVSGLSASGVRVEFFRLLGKNGKEKVFEVRTNEEGRISENFDSEGHQASDYELVFHIGEYLSERKNREDNPLIDTVVMRIRVTDHDRRYHIPVLISPHSYTVWWSGNPDP